MNAIRIIVSLTVFFTAATCSAQSKGMWQCGFLPPSEYAAGFAQSPGSTWITVFPTVVREMQGTTYSETSQQEIVAFLEDNSIGKGVAEEESIDTSIVKAQAQYPYFQDVLIEIKRNIKKKRVELRLLHASRTPHNPNQVALARRRRDTVLPPRLVRQQRVLLPHQRSPQDIH